MTAARKTAAGGSTARDPFAAGEDSALSELRLRWADAYDIKVDGGIWKAARRGGGQQPLTAGTPGELARAMRADWAREGTL